MKCTSCGKYPFCPKADTSVQNCTEWVKQKYQEIERKEK